MGALHPHKCAACAFPIDEKPSPGTLEQIFGCFVLFVKIAIAVMKCFELLCRVMKKLAVWALPLLLIQLDCQGGQENLQYRKPEWGQDNYQQLPHKASTLQLDDQAIDNTANRADHLCICYFFMFAFFNSLKSSHWLGENQMENIFQLSSYHVVKNF